MLVQFNEISPHGTCYQVQGVEGLSLQQDFILKGPLDAQCTLTRKGDAKVEMQGRLKATLSLVCDRCLACYDVNVDTKMQTLFETVSSDSWHLKELEYSIPDLDNIVLDEPVIDLDDVLRQQLYLALPVKSLCSEQCRGLCPQCGVNLNIVECRCADEGKKSPFAVLAKLKE